MDSKFRILGGCERRTGAMDLMAKNQGSLTVLTLYQASFHHGDIMKSVEFRHFLQRPVFKPSEFQLERRGASFFVNGQS